MLNSSSLYHKLRTNGRLTNEEETEVRRAMTASLNKLRRVESEIARLQGKFIVLGQRKKDFERSTEDHQRLLSPIGRLSPEILQEIFWRCLPAAHNSVLSFKERPLVLGRVCSQWRQIAYSTPKLWSSLHISASPLTYPPARARFKALDAWLSRSGSLPLSISMSNIEWIYMTMEQIRPYFKLISKYARRWKYIHLQVELCDYMNFHMKITADDVPLLELFHIQRDPFGFRGALAHSFWGKGGILSTSLLRVLSINDFSVRLLDLPAQFGQLTGLGLESTCFNLRDISKIFALCPNLDTCAITVGDPDDLSSPTSAISQSLDDRPAIVLPKLRTLKVHGLLNENSELLNLLNDLFTPALRHFAYTRSYSSLMPEMGIPFTEQSSSSLNSFRSFFRRLNEPLEELDFLADGIETSYVMGLLSLFPELKRLSLRCSFSIAYPSGWLFNVRLLLGFIPYEHRRHCQSCTLKEDEEETHDSIFPPFACLCPNLEILNINGALVSKHILLEFLHSRLVDYDTYNVTRLRRFSVSFHLRWEDEVMMEEIDGLSEESGLLVELRHTPLATFRQASSPLPSKYCPSQGIREIFGS